MRLRIRPAPTVFRAALGRAEVGHAASAAGRAPATDAADHRAHLAAEVALLEPTAPLAEAGAELLVALRAAAGVRPAACAAGEGRLALSAADADPVAAAVVELERAARGGGRRAQRLRAPGRAAAGVERAPSAAGLGRLALAAAHVADAAAAVGEAQPSALGPARGAQLGVRLGLAIAALADAAADVLDAAAAAGERLETDPAADGPSAAVGDVAAVLSLLLAGDWDALGDDLLAARLGFAITGGEGEQQRQREEEEAGHFTVSGRFGERYVDESKGSEAKVVPAGSKAFTFTSRGAPSSRGRSQRAFRLG